MFCVIPKPCEIFFLDNKVTGCVKPQAEVFEKKLNNLFSLKQKDMYENIRGL